MNLRWQRLLRVVSTIACVTLLFFFRRESSFALDPQTLEVFCVMILSVLRLTARIPAQEGDQQRSLGVKVNHATKQQSLHQATTTQADTDTHCMYGWWQSLVTALDRTIKMYPVLVVSDHVFVSQGF